MATNKEEISFSPPRMTFKRSVPKSKQETALGTRFVGISNGRHTEAMSYHTVPVSQAQKDLSSDVFRGMSCVNHLGSPGD